VCIKSENQFLLTTLGLIGLKTRSNKRFLGLLLLNRNVDPWGASENLRELGAWLEWVDALRPKAKDNHLATGATPSLVSIGSIKGLARIDLELIEISHHTTGAIEDSQCPSLGDMIQDGGVPRLHLLVSSLSFTGVVKAAVRVPSVVVTVPLASNRIGENEDIGRLRRRADTTLRAAAELFVKLPACNGRSRFQLPICRQETPAFELCQLLH
jgi:hypothetical protein